MFMGEYSHSLDAKGRVSVPAKFREELGSEFVATKGLDECVFVFPLEQWQKFEKKLNALPITNKNARSFARFFLAGANSLETDKQGRVLLPSGLREFAHLEKDVVIIGAADRVEIWNKDKWTEYSSVDDEDMDQIAENMSELGIGF